MRTIQSRIQHCKNRVPIAAPKIEESAQLQKDVDEFLKNGGKIKVVGVAEANFVNDIEKCKRVRRKMPKRHINLNDYQGMSGDHTLSAKDLAKILKVKSDGTIHNYFKAGVIPKPSILGIKSRTCHQWTLKDLIKHNKELEK
jgi:hypothetical protein